MKYGNIVRGIFLNRPNRFIAQVLLGEETAVCHVKNTGRCRELLIPGTKVLLEYHPNAAAAGRKTAYDLIGVYKGELLINMDSQAPNQAAWEWLATPDCTETLAQAAGLVKPRVADLRREVTYEDSRFDLAFSLEDRGQLVPAFMEVKGVTLEENGIALFPDAPTQRGVKHLNGLIRARENGFLAFALFVIQMKGITEFTPNMATHPEFGRTLERARAAGVAVMAMDCVVGEDSMYLDRPVRVRLG